MGVLMLSVLLLVLVAGGECSPFSNSENWQTWYRLQQQKRMQQQDGQEPGQQWPPTPPQDGGMRHQLLQQMLRKQQEEWEQQMSEEVEDPISGLTLEDLALQLGTDAMWSILRQRSPTHAHLPMDSCLTKNIPVMFVQFRIAGDFVYTVCGSANGATVHLRFHQPGDTTPSMDTTTPLITTVGTTPSPPSPCPTLPMEDETTPEEPETTTPAEPEDTTTPN